MSPVDFLESSGLRAAGYAVTGLICVVAASREACQSAVRWRAFWYLTAAVLVAMALARAIGIDDLLTQLGRERARLDGWYRTRRRLQGVLVGTVAATWIVVVFVSIWRVPERRRRYLPTALAAFTIVCFAAARLVSLHQVVAVLYRRPIAGVPVVAIVEWSLLALTATAIIVSPSFGLHRGHPSTNAAKTCRAFVEGRSRVSNLTKPPQVRDQPRHGFVQLVELVGDVVEPHRPSPFQEAKDVGATLDVK